MTSFFEDILKEKPDVPTWEGIDPGVVQQQTQQGNLTSFQGAKALADQYDTFMAQQMQKRLAQTFPQFAGLQERGADVISSRLKGVLSTSDAADSQRASAARGLGLGIAGSPAGTALTLRDLGIKQYQAQSEGMSMLPGYAGTVGALTKAPTFDFSTVFMNPAQRFQMQFENQGAQWGVNWLKNQVAAMPSGIGYAFAKQADTDIGDAQQMGASIMGAAASGAGGAAGGGY